MDNQIIMCEIHKEYLCSYCRNCKDLVCFTCIKDTKHKGHTFVKLH